MDGGAAARTALGVSELDHEHQCPACKVVRACSMMHCRGTDVVPDWQCVERGLATWPPVPRQPELFPDGAAPRTHRPRR